MPWALPPAPALGVTTSGTGSGVALALPAPPTIPTGPTAEQIDPYGVDLAIDPTGDLRVTHSGSLGAVAGPDNCAQAVFLRLKTPQGELALHPDYGSQLEDRMVGGKLSADATVAALNADLRDLLANDPRFVAAKIVQVQLPATTGDTGSIQLGVQAQLFGGEELLLGDTSDPSPTDVTLPQITDPSIDPTLIYDPELETEFFADQSELDTLNDLNAQQSMIDDFPPVGGVS